jgi:hypothetical protein
MLLLSLLPVSFIGITLVTSFIFLSGLITGAKNKSALLTSGAAIIAGWLLLTGILAWNGFYLQTNAFPPRLLFALAPALLMVIWIVTGKRKTVSLAMPLKTLTLIHLIRIPVELVLLQLYHMGKVPLLMTFEGRNFDILSGLTAPLIYFIALRQKKHGAKILIVWNVMALLLLFNIVINAILSVPTPLQQFAFDQPDIGVLMFPYVWLPALVVPVVLFSHIVSLMKLIEKVKIQSAYSTKAGLKSA